MWVERTTDETNWLEKKERERERDEDGMHVVMWFGFHLNVPINFGRQWFDFSAVDGSIVKLNYLITHVINHVTISSVEHHNGIGRKK